MKKLFIVFFTMSLFVACKEQKDVEEEVPAVNDEQVQEMAYLDYGVKITDKDVIDALELRAIYDGMTVGDTTAVKVKGMIADVCVKKGCWIKLPVGNQAATVKFKDYSFFLPKNGKGKEVILSGKAYKNVTPVEELRHYAQDAGKSKEEIAAIVKEEVTLSFVADGALVEKFDNPDVEQLTNTEE
ncbi:DUF4920 domain-containing protein [uncultured Nonlabens sp.]|uniref:DUF4920 domain-containing protein n=1 Tax=uncultured Nonlabens sp. TaxID=859306 RepID=UPI002636FCDB|nr:DUF4920 domain-containing protein [uncultured Nonlabens sp.]